MKYISRHIRLAIGDGKGGLIRFTNFILDTNDEEIIKTVESNPDFLSRNIVVATEDTPIPKIVCNAKLGATSTIDTEGQEGVPVSVKSEPSYLDNKIQSSVNKGGRPKGSKNKK